MLFTCYAEPRKSINLGDHQEVEIDDDDNPEYNDMLPLTHEFLGKIQGEPIQIMLDPIKVIVNEPNPVVVLSDVINKVIEPVKVVEPVNVLSDVPERTNKIKLNVNLTGIAEKVAKKEAEDAATYEKDTFFKFLVPPVSVSFPESDICREAEKKAQRIVTDLDLKFNENFYNTSRFNAPKKDWSIDFSGPISLVQAAMCLGKTYQLIQWLKLPKNKGKRILLVINRR